VIEGVEVVGVSWLVGGECCLLDSLVEDDGEALVGLGVDGVVVGDPDLVEEGLVAQASQVVVEAGVQVVGVAGQVEDVA